MKQQKFCFHFVSHSCLQFSIKEREKETEREREREREREQRNGL